MLGTRCQPRPAAAHSLLQAGTELCPRCLRAPLWPWDTLVSWRSVAGRALPASAPDVLRHAELRSSVSSFLALCLQLRAQLGSNPSPSLGPTCRHTLPYRAPIPAPARDTPLGTFLSAALFSSGLPRLVLPCSLDQACSSQGAVRVSFQCTTKSPQIQAKWLGVQLQACCFAVPCVWASVGLGKSRQCPRQTVFLSMDPIISEWGMLTCRFFYMVSKSISFSFRLHFSDQVWSWQHLGTHTRRPAAA